MFNNRKNLGAPFFCPDSIYFWFRTSGHQVNSDLDQFLNLQTTDILESSWT